MIPEPSATEQGLRIRAAIHSIRGEFVMLDRDVAAFFGKNGATAINQNRSRNRDRFPESYAFQLAVGRIEAWMEKPRLDGEKIAAEVRKLQAETEKALFEARRADAETARIWAEVMQMRLATLGQMRQMAEQLERDEVTDALDEAFGTDRRAILPPPRP